jgi:uncharacterized cupredoxin-like copper-binding protein
MSSRALSTRAQRWSTLTVSVLQSNSVEITSLRDLAIGKPFATTQGTPVIRQNQREVILGSMCSKKQRVSMSVEAQRVSG